MKAVFISRGEIRYRDTDSPKVKDGVIVNVIYAGLCGSDAQRIEMIQNSKIDHPSILGHEIIGVIESVGIGREDTLKKGDFVVISPIISCKKCSFCRHGYIQFCQRSTSLGKTLDGGFAEQVFVPDIDNLYKIPKDKFCRELVLSDPLAVCIHACNKIDSLSGKSIAIIGDGTIGEMLSRLVMYKRAKEIVVVSKNFKSKEVRYHSGKIAYKSISDILKENYTEHFDIVFECVGREEKAPFDIAVKITKKMGMIIVLGAYKPNYLLPISARSLFSKEITVIGSNSYDLSEKRDEFSEAIKIITNKKIELDGIITHTLPLEDFSKGLELFRNKKISRAKKIIFKN